MKVPVYIETNASKLIGYVDINQPKDFEDAAYALWESQDHNYPSLCHACSTFDLSDWEIWTGEDLEYYFKDEK